MSGSRGPESRKGPRKNNFPFSAADASRSCQRLATPCRGRILAFSLGGVALGLVWLTLPVDVARLASGAIAITVAVAGVGRNLIEERPTMSHASIVTGRGGERRGKIAGGP